MQIARSLRRENFQEEIVELKSVIRQHAIWSLILDRYFPKKHLMKSVESLVRPLPDRTIHEFQFESISIGESNTILQCLEY